MKDELIIQGFQVFLRDGTTKAFGMELNDTKDVTQIQVPDDQYIKAPMIRSGEKFIHALAFRTNDEDEILARVGGTGGALYRHIGIIGEGHAIENFYLAGIAGKTLNYQGTPCICELRFIFVIYIDTDASTKKSFPGHSIRWYHGPHLHRKPDTWYT